MSNESILMMIVIGGVAGWLAGLVMRFAFPPLRTPRLIAIPRQPLPVLMLGGTADQVVP
jgi:hypothetical protein